MPIEPHNAITLTRPRIMPPKPEVKLVAPVEEGETPLQAMMRMAKAESAAAKKINGVPQRGQGMIKARGEALPHVRRARERTEALVKAFKAREELTWKEVAEIRCGKITKQAARDALASMREKGYKIAYCRKRKVYSLSEDSLTCKNGFQVGSVASLLIEAAQAGPVQVRSFCNDHSLSVGSIPGAIERIQSEGFKITRRDGEVFLRGEA